jgi:hypothetical protein
MKRPWSPGPWTPGMISDFAMHDYQVDGQFEVASQIKKNIECALKAPEMAELLVRLANIAKMYPDWIYFAPSTTFLIEDALTLLKSVGWEGE